jgi:hypothetical protein
MALGDALGGTGSSTTANAGAPVLLTILTVADMPVSSKSKGAPCKFTGKYNKILPFLRDCELLLTKCGVSSDRAKCSLWSGMSVSMSGKLLRDYLNMISMTGLA